MNQFNLNRPPATLKCSHLIMARKLKVSLHGSMHALMQSVECNQALWLVSCMCLFGSALNTDGMYTYSIESPYFRLSNLDDCIKCHYFDDADPRHNSTEL